MSNDIRRDVRVLFVTRDLNDNSTGRTYALWLLSEHLGWSSRVVSLYGSSVWRPVSDTAFAEVCEAVSSDSAGEERLRALTVWADVVVAVKPVEASFGTALWMTARVKRPLILDIDDPDAESELSIGRPLRAVAKFTLRHTRYKRSLSLYRAMETVPRFVSNAVLQERHGGALLPHPRIDTGPGTSHSTDRPSVVFVGTNRPHKGVNTLRDAVAKLSSEGYRLTVTDVPPSDAKPWENWIGGTTLQAGIEEVKRGDIVVIPSLKSELFARGQLPAKLVDGMLAGRAVVVSDLRPMTWAGDDAVLAFKSGSVGDLVRQLSALQDPKARALLGAAARTRALSMFEVSATAKTFYRVVLETIAARPGASQ